MYECPNCAGNIKFHIGKQQLYCEYCDTTLPPYYFHKTSDAEEQNCFEVTVFTCPQCGGELLTEDTTAATFCSYCGASTILFSRISKEQKPKYIIPFKKTKEDCRKSYKRMINKAFFAPKELRDETHIEKFRGIYMPYWLYSYRKNGTSTFKGYKLELDSKYKTTEYYNINCEVTAQYDDIAFDASSQLADGLSRSIAPFDMTEKKVFTPAYLSGFYADRTDITPDTYKEDAEAIVLADICEHLQKDKTIEPYNIKEQMKDVRLIDTLKQDKTYTELAMLPIWFLSYRKKDRVAYAIVNGQTGEAAADLPIDIRKFSIASLLLAIPIILLLNAFLTLTPSMLLVACILISALFAFICNILSTNLLLKEVCEDIHLAKEQESEQKRQKEKLILILGVLFIGLIELPYIFLFLFVHVIKNNILMAVIITLVFFSYLCIDLYQLHDQKTIKNIDTEQHRLLWNKKLFIMLKPMFTMVIALLVLFVNPVSDIIFYGTAILCLGMIFWSICDMIHCHNLLTTRRLPQLNKRGGEEHA